MYVCMCVCVYMYVCMYMQHVLCSVLERVVYLMCLFCGPHKRRFYDYIHIIHIHHVCKTIIIYYINIRMCIHPAVEAAANSVFMVRLRACSQVPSTHAP